VRPLSSGRPLVLAAAAALLFAGATLPAVADPSDDETPTRSEVREAKHAVVEGRRSVAEVRTELLLANQSLEQAAVAAAKAGEAYNGARWRLDQARTAVAQADARATEATERLATQQQALDQVVATTYEDAPDLQALDAVLGQDGIDGMVESADATYQVTTALDDIRDAYDAAREVADIATDQAEAARADAAALEQAAAVARNEAEAKQNAAAAEAERVAGEKDRLLAELARLQHISVRLATRRQAALEAAAQAAAAAAAEAAAQKAAAQETADQAAQEARDHDQPSTPDPDPTPDPQPQPDPEPQPDPDPPAPSSSGAQRAIAFAKGQLGEPYVWGAAGPDSWDCSGLTMGSWQAGGKYLPHYSVAQYDAATPIGVGQLQPGDLVFWGSSSSPSSIYHVALYLGGGQIIHAPRTERPVTIDSMYYWIPPNFFARP
jgi:cell wall-associated NlpC family hydrolase